MKYEESIRKESKNEKKNLLIFIILFIFKTAV